MLAPAIYSHGFSLRLRVHPGAVTRAMDALARHLHFRDRRRWKARGERLCMGGSGWLTGCKPSRRTVLGQLNRKHKLAVYNFAVIERRDAIYIDFEGVRRRDVGGVMGDLLGLGEDDYATEYFRRLERYIVVSPHGAHRVALALGAEPHRERGRRSRLRWLAHDLQWTVTIRQRATAVARGKIYRVMPERGATAAYRLEVWLEGDRRGRTVFAERDIAVLDQILLELIEAHDLHPLVRPSCWEGEGGPVPDVGRREPALGRLTMKAYRGSKRCVAAAGCHPPSDPETAPVVVLGPAGGRTNPGACISCPIPAAFDGHDAEAARSPPSSRWIALAKEIASDTVCSLVEVVLDAHEDPGYVARALVRELGGPGKVAVGHISLGDTWYSVEELRAELPPVTGDEQSLVLVVEPDVFAQLVVAEGLDAAGRGTLDDKKFSRELRRWSSGSQHCDLGPLFWTCLRELRSLGEETALRVVIISADDRSTDGQGAWNGSHQCTGTRVRSTMGDAGRYWAHARYRVGREEIVMLKDERHGKVGRLVWHRESRWKPIAFEHALTSAHVDQEATDPLAADEVPFDDAAAQDGSWSVSHPHGPTPCGVVMFGFDAELPREW